MNDNCYPVRKQLNHRGPLSINITDAIYFITIAAEERGSSVLTDCAEAILSAARYYQTTGKWFLHLFLIMPDHLHMLVHVPATGVDIHGESEPRSNGDSLGGGCGVPGGHALPAGDGVPGGHALPRGLARTIGDFKRFLTNKHGIRFQVNFFDTRIRDDAHFAEKWNYICRNPVARGRVALPKDWPYSIAFDSATMKERPHR